MAGPCPSGPPQCTVARVAPPVQVFKGYLPEHEGGTDPGVGGDHGQGLGGAAGREPPRLPNSEASTRVTRMQASAPSPRDRRVTWHRCCATNTPDQRLRLPFCSTKSSPRSSRAARLLDESLETRATWGRGAHPSPGALPFPPSRVTQQLGAECGGQAATSWVTRIQSAHPAAKGLERGRPWG